MLENTLLEISDNLQSDLYRRDPAFQFLSIDRMTALVLLDLVEAALDKEDAPDGTR